MSQESLGAFHRPSVSPRLNSQRISLIMILLASCVALSMTGFGIIVPVFPQRLQALGLGAETLAMMEMAFGLGMVLFSTPMGTLADRLGRKPILMMALAGFIATNIAFVFVTTPLLFIVIRFVEGSCIAGLLPTASTIVADLVPKARQGRWLGALMSAQAAGAAVGPGIGGLLFEGWGFLTPFLLSASIAALASFFCFILVPETLSKRVREQERSRWTEKQQAFPLSSRLTSFPKPVGFFAALLVIDFSLSFAYPFVLPLYPFFFDQVLGYNAAQYGVILSTYGLALSVFSLLFGRLIEGSSRFLLIALGCLLVTALNLGMLFFQHYPLLLVAALVTGMGPALYQPGLGLLYLRSTNEQNRSRVMGLRGTALALGILLGPLLQALVSPWVKPSTSFTLSILIPLGVIILILFVSRSLGQGKEREETLLVQAEQIQETCIDRA